MQGRGVGAESLREGRALFPWCHVQGLSRWVLLGAACQSWGTFLSRVLWNQPVLIADQVCTGPLPLSSSACLLELSWSSEPRPSSASHTWLLSSGWT